MTVRTSVVIPCYNVDRFLEDALNSVREQTLQAYEIILVDDGSKVPIYIPCGWNGPPIKLIRTPNRGLPAARNLGIHHSQGELVCFLDADDIWLPNKVELQTRALAEHLEAVACYTRCIVANGFYGFGPYPPENVSEDEFLLVLWHDLFFPPSTVMVRREALDAVGWFREDLRNGEDIELWLRLLQRGRFVQVPEPLTGYRQHAQQFTMNLETKLLGSKQSRAVMIAEHSTRLIQAGLPRKKLWYSYRKDILNVYYRRQFGPARKLLFDYWRDHPNDLSILVRAAISLLPAGLIRYLRGAIPDHPASSLDAQLDDGWKSAVLRVRDVISC